MFVLVEIVNPQIVWPLEFGAEVDVPPCHRVSCFAIPGCPAASWGGGACWLVFHLSSPKASPAVRLAQTLSGGDYQGLP